MFKVLFLAATAAVLAGCASSAAQAQQRAMLARGDAIAESQCSSCHAVGRRGESPAPEAPPFRTLSSRYRLDSLEEALAEGISVGHPAMPEFQFAPDDVHALISYLQSIQHQPDGPPRQ